MSEHQNIKSEFLKTDIADIDMDALIAEAEAEPQLHAPAYLKEEILKKSQGISVQVPIKLQKQKKELSKQMQFLFYSLKISAAVILCLFQLVLIDKLPTGISLSISESMDEYRYEQLEKEKENADADDLPFTKKAEQTIQSILNNITNGGN